MNGVSSVFWSTESPLKSISCQEAWLRIERILSVVLRPVGEYGSLLRDRPGIATISAIASTGLKTAPGSASIFCSRLPAMTEGTTPVLETPASQSAINIMVEVRFAEAACENGRQSLRSSQSDGEPEREIAGRDQRRLRRFGRKTGTSLLNCWSIRFRRSC